MSFSNSRVNKQQGFTLLEVLMALVIFSMFSISAYSVFQGVIQSDDTSKRKIARITELETGMAAIHQDVTQLVDRTWRQDGARVSVYIYQGNSVVQSDDDQLMFVRAGWFNPNGQLKRSELRKVAYRLYQGQLERLSWNHPDSAPGADVQISPLITNVKSFKVRFYSEGQWLNQWSSAQIPSAIEISLTLNDYGEVHRRFLVSTGA